MNVSNSPSTSAPSGDQAAQATQGRREVPPRGEQRGKREEFERALLAKALPADAENHESATPDAILPDGALPMMAWVPTQLHRPAEAPPAAAAGVVETATGTRAAIETALHNAEPQAIHPLTGAERPSVWEASVGGMQGTVEPERIVTNGAPPSWGLTIGASALSADVAARHTPKLHERLLKRGIDVDHVRIERKRDRDDGPR
jgi:hypothetical protein